MGQAIQVNKYFGENMNVSLLSETATAPIRVNLSNTDGARHGLILGLSTDNAVGQILDGVVNSEVPIIALVSGELPWFYDKDLVHVFRLSDSRMVEALERKLAKTLQGITAQSKRTLLYCGDLSELLRHNSLARLIGRGLAYGRKTGLSVLLRSRDSEAIQNCAQEVAAQILPNLSFILTTEGEEYLLDDVRDTSASNASLFEAMPSFDYSPKFIAQFDSAEAAERAAWMLRGECINKIQVDIPLHNANSSVLDTVASLVGSRWAWVKADE